MGLQEKRLVHQFQTEIVPKYEKEIAEIAGYPIPVEIDWEPIANDRPVLDNLELQALNRTTEVFRSLCGDEVGKEAVKAAVQKIRFSNTEPDKIFATLRDGVVEIGCSWGLAPEGILNQYEIIAALEPLL